MEQDYKIDIEEFAGPLSLLLHLIRIEKVDIYDIPISRITEHFKEYVDIINELDLEMAGDFYLMIAILMKIKSRMLLPAGDGKEDEDDFELNDDPRKELVDRLLEYKKYKELSIHLGEKLKYSENSFSRAKNLPEGEGEINFREADFFALVTSFKKVLESRRKNLPREVEGEEFKVEDKINFILDRIKYAEFIRFSDLFINASCKLEMITTFIAILELIKLNKIVTRQREVFSDIYVYGVKND